MKAAPRKDLAICKVSSPTETPVTVQGSRNADLDRVRAAMRDTFRACLAGGMTQDQAADLVMATLVLGAVSARLPPEERARMHLGIQAETRNLVVGIQAGRAKRAA